MVITFCFLMLINLRYVALYLYLKINKFGARYFDDTEQETSVKSRFYLTPDSLKWLQTFQNGTKSELLRFIS